MLSFRKVLIDTIKPFFEQLNNNSNEEKYHINEEKHIPFLKSLSNYEIEILYEYKIINEEIYKDVIRKQKISSINSSESKMNEEDLLKKYNLNYIDVVVTDIVVYEFSR